MSILYHIVPYCILFYSICLRVYFWHGSAKHVIDVTLLELHLEQGDIQSIGVN